MLNLYIRITILLELTQYFSICYNIAIKHLNNLNKGIFIGISLLLPYLILVTSSFPYLGVTVSLAILASFTFFYKSKKTYFDKYLYIAIIALSFFVTLRANPFVNFLNIVASIYLISILSINFKERKVKSILDYVFLPLIVLIKTITTKNTYPIFAKFKIKNKNQEASQIIIGLIITFFTLILVIPLLASTNPIFAIFIQNILYNISNIGYITENIVLYIFRFIFFVVLLITLPKYATYLNEKPNLIKQPELKINFLIIPKIAVSAVLFIFFITQFQLYFASKEVLEALNYSYSQYAREVFGQLSLVALIIFALIYNDKNKDQKGVFTTYVLVFQAIFLTLMALKSVYEYSSTWGLTEKRLWGYTGVIWIIIAFSIFVYNYYKNTKNYYVIKGLIILTTATLVSINLLNFDSLVYKYRAKTEEGIDYQYIAKRSTDLAYSKEILNAVIEEYKYEVQQSKLSMEEYRKINSQVYDTYGYSTASVRSTNLENAYYEILSKKTRINSVISISDFRSFNIARYIYNKQDISKELAKMEELIDAKN